LSHLAISAAAHADESLCCCFVVRRTYILALGVFCSRARFVGWMRRQFRLVNFALV
jgi:hypothetical protein